MFVGPRRRTICGVNRSVSKCTRSHSLKCFEVKCFVSEELIPSVSLNNEQLVAKWIIRIAVVRNKTAGFPIVKAKRILNEAAEPEELTLYLGVGLGLILHTNGAHQGIPMHEHLIFRTKIDEFYSGFFFFNIPDSKTTLFQFGKETP